MICDVIQLKMMRWLLVTWCCVSKWLHVCIPACVRTCVGLCRDMQSKLVRISSLYHVHLCQCICSTRARGCTYTCMRMHVLICTRMFDYMHPQAALSEAALKQFDPKARSMWVYFGSSLRDITRCIGSSAVSIAPEFHQSIALIYMPRVRPDLKWTQFTRNERNDVEEPTGKGMQRAWSNLE